MICQWATGADGVTATLRLFVNQPLCAKRRLGLAFVVEAGFTRSAASLTGPGASPEQGVATVPSGTQKLAVMSKPAARIQSRQLRAS